MTAFSRYGVGRGFSLQELVERQREQQLLTARSEDSGCEGTYVEVAEWSNERQRWERLCFLKCFGGEYPSEPDLPERETALRFVQDINGAFWGADEAPIIHCLPNVPDGSASPVTVEDCRKLLMEWEKYARTMIEADLIAGPTDLRNRTVAVLDATSV